MAHVSYVSVGYIYIYLHIHIYVCSCMCIYVCICVRMSKTLILEAEKDLGRSPLSTGHKKCQGQSEQKYFCETYSYQNYQEFSYQQELSHHAVGLSCPLTHQSLRRFLEKEEVFTCKVHRIFTYSNLELHVCTFKNMLLLT